ncbi:MAG: Holliday junction branch migration protein RuvA, partial [Anaerolineae bacterium]|nr:Holliday junction branch migration protein RuvA [Anaerolineae bacterium]
MIASIQGRVMAAYSDHVVVMVNGIGYKVFVPEPALLEEHDGETVFLHT